MIVTLFLYLITALFNGLIGLLPQDAGFDYVTFTSIRHSMAYVYGFNTFFPLNHLLSDAVLMIGISLAMFGVRIVIWFFEFTRGK